MATADLYIDVANGRFVQSPDNQTVANLPPFVRGTTQNLRIMLLKPTGAAAGTVYDKIPVAGQTIQLAIGTLGGSSYLTSQFTWTASTDLAEPFYSAALPLNTANITTAVGSNPSVACVLQIDRIESGIPTNVILQSISIKNAIIVDGTEVSTPGRTLLYAETASAMFLTRNIVGRVRWINDSDSTIMNEMFTDTDGTLQTQQVT